MPPNAISNSPAMAPARGRITKRRSGGAGGGKGEGRGGGGGGSGGGRCRPPKGVSQRASKVKQREQWAAEKAVQHKKACAEGRQRKAEKEKQYAAAVERGENPKKPEKKKKRLRGGATRGRVLVVRKAGDPQPKAFGRIVKTDLDVKNVDDDAVPRKARELFALMAKSKGDLEGMAKWSGENKNVKEDADGEAGVPDVEASEKEKKKEKKIDGTNVKFDGIQEGETYKQFTKRIEEEKRKAHLSVARAGNRQREKKRAFYEKRRERAMRRARHKRGQFSDDEEDVKEEMDESVEAGHSGALAAVVDRFHDKLADMRKSRKNRHKRDEETPWNVGVAEPKFGEQAEMPPSLAHSLRNAPPKRSVPISAAALLE